MNGDSLRASASGAGPSTPYSSRTQLLTITTSTTTKTTMPSIEPWTSSGRICPSSSSRAHHMEKMYGLLGCNT